MKKLVTAVILVLFVLVITLSAHAAGQPTITLQPQSPNYPEYSCAVYTVKAEGSNLSATWYLQYNGKTYNISKNSIQKEGKWLIPVEEFSKEILGKYVFSFHTGFFIIGDENEVLDTSDWQYGSFRKTIDRYTKLNDIDFLNGFLAYDRPEAEKLKEDF